MESHRSIAKAENRTGHDGIRSRRLTDQQVAAIRLAAEMGDAIRKSHPEIAEEYRSGLTASELVARHGFDRRHGVSRRTAVGAVRNAIGGYSGLCYEPYQGLIGDRTERENLALAHNRRTGVEEYQRKRGIHGLTREQKAAACRKGGLIRGPLSYRLRIGCHALPPEVVREQCRKIASLGGKAGGVASVVAQGMVPYTPAVPGRIAETEFAFRLAADPLYRGPVRANFGEIAEKVNEVFHAGIPHYTRITMKIALQRHGRHQRSRTGSPADPEMSFTDSLARDPAYQFPARIKAEEIARKVNQEYHGGKPVRNPLGIRAAIQRYRRQHEGSSMAPAVA
jgi:hypothetical protein